MSQKKESSYYADELDKYIKELKEDEKKREPFDNYFNSLKKKFFEYLKKKHDKKTAKKQIGIIGMFGLFLSMRTGIEKIEEVTKNMANDDFWIWYNRNALNDLTKKEIREIINSFFSFLDKENGAGRKRFLS